MKMCSTWHGASTYIQASSCPVPRHLIWHYCHCQSQRTHSLASTPITLPAHTYLASTPALTSLACSARIACAAAQLPPVADSTHVVPFMHVACVLSVPGSFSACEEQPPPMQHTSVSNHNTIHAHMPCTDCVPCTTCMHAGASASVPKGPLRGTARAAAGSGYGA